MSGPQIASSRASAKKMADKKIVIVGGGFAGLNLAKALSLSADFKITVVDRNNYHFFPPLLYQVSTAFIEPSNITYPFRKLFQRYDNIRFYMGSLLQISPELNLVQLDSGTLSYDYLVIAMGTETNFFNNQNVIARALPMKTVEDALTIRNHILLKIEAAVRATSVEDRERLSNIVIAGGGPTGVEMAGMLAEMGRNIVTKDYPEATRNAGNIYLIDGLPTLLGPMSNKAQQEAYRVLTDLGVNIKLDTLVKDYVDETVVLSNGENIKASTLIWTSGVIGSQINGLSPECVTKGRRLVVDNINRVAKYDNIFAVGDISYQTSDPSFPNGHPQLAQVAIQQGKHLAENLRLLERNKKVSPFRYKDRGSMAIIAKFKAVVDTPNGSLAGFFAWLLWLFIHIIPLVGFRNKVKLGANWLFSFLTDDPTLRLIIQARPVETRRKQSVPSKV